jgi:TRAP-type C4-dicarboxylate transport system permease small subunit
MKRLDRLDHIISRVENILIVFMLSLMIIMAFMQIVLRNLFATGFSWADVLVRYLVLWVAFIGASLATREGKHINIDVFSRWISGKTKGYIKTICELCSLIICALLAYAAVKFILFETQMGGTTFFGLPVWLPQLIIPITFGLMTFRFALRCFKACMRNLDADSDSEQNYTL